MGDVTSVKISENGSKTEVGHGGISNFSGKDGVVPYTPNPIKQSSVDKFQVNADGDYKHDDTKITRVVSGGNVPAGGLDFQDQFGRQVSDPRKVKESDTIRVGNTRCSVRVALDMGLVKVDGQGNYTAGEYQPDSAKQSEATPLHKTENLKTVDHQNTINALNQRVSPSVTDSFVNQIVGNILSGKDCNGLVADYAANAGATPESIHAFFEEYVNSLYGSGIDYAVRASKGALSSAEIEQHLEKLSTQYKRSLLLGLHHNHLKAAHELIQIVKAKRIV